MVNAANYLMLQLNKGLKFQRIVYFCHIRPTTLSQTEQNTHDNLFGNTHSLTNPHRSNLTERKRVMKRTIYSAIAILAVSVASQASALDIGGVSATSSGGTGGSSTGSSQVSAPAGISQSLPVGTNLESQLTNQQNQALQT